MASQVFGVFLSYRRDDAAGHAGRLADTLAGRFGTQSVFIDVDSIEPGADFVAALTEALRRCQVMLVVVGTRWIDAEVGGRRRLDDPDDFVRMELELALQQGLRVVPVLVGGATMPSRESLPSALEAFARCNAFEMSDRAWNESSRVLLDLIERWRETDEPSERVSAVGEDGPEPSREGSEHRRSVRRLPLVHDLRDAKTESPPSKRPRSTRSFLSRRRTLLAAGTALVVLIGVLVGVSVDRRSRKQISSPSATPTAAGYTPRFKAVSCPVGTGGGPGVTCGYLVVPQDRTHPKGLQVRLLVTRAPADTASPAADPIVELGSISGDAEGPSTTARLYSNYIELSVRGGPGSVPELACPGLEAATEASLALPPRSSQALTEEVAAFSACRARLVAAGIDLNVYGADAAAADVRDLLQVLHIKQANLLAAFGRSLVAFDIMRQYPRFVRSVAIEDGVPPGFDSDAAAVSNLAGALSRYAALCSTDARCHAAFPDLRGQMRRDYAGFQQHPMTVKVSVQPGRAPIPVIVDGDSGDEVLAAGLDAAASLPITASLLYAPNPAIVARGIVIRNVGNGNQISVGYPVIFSYFCKDLLPGVPDNRRLEEQASALAYPELAGIDAGFQLDLRVCQAWNLQPDNPEDFTPIVSDIPTFLFGELSTQPDHRPGPPRWHKASPTS